MPRILTVYYKHKPGGFCKRIRLAIEACLDRGWVVHYVAVAPFPYSHANLHPHLLPTPMKRHDTLWFWAYFFLTAPWFTLYVAMKQRIRFLFAVSPLYALITLAAKCATGSPLLTFILSKPRFNTETREQYRFLHVIEHGLEKLGLICSNLLLANSSGSRQAWVEEYGPPAERIGVLTNHVDDPPFDKEEQRRKVREEFSLERDRFLIVSAGMLEKHKNLDLLIGAFARVDHPRTVLIIIGDGDRAEALRVLASQCAAAGRILFTGWRGDVRSLIQGSDLFIQPSLREGMSEVLLEAMTCRVPCLVSAIPESMEVVRNPEQHFPPHDPEELAKNINRCIEDPSYYRELLHSTLEDKDRYVFDWKRELRDRIESLLKGKKQGPNGFSGGRKKIRKGG